MNEFPPPVQENRVLAPSGMCLDFGCPCDGTTHPVLVPGPYPLDDEEGLT